MAVDFELLDIKQAAELLNVTETSLRRWTNAGRLACLRLGVKRERRFRRSDLLEFLEHQPARGRKPPTVAIERRLETSEGVTVAHGTHLCALYVDEVGRTKLAADFLAEGLKEGGACYLLAPPTATREVLGELERRRWPVHEEIGAGRLVLSEYLPSGAAQLRALKARFTDSVRRGHQSLRLVGTISEGLLATGQRLDDALHFEAVYDRLLAHRFPLVTMCQYDARRHSGKELCEVLRCHPGVFRYPVERLLY